MDLHLQSVTPHQAKDLTEMGFPYGNCINAENTEKTSGKFELNFAPTLELAAKWLREDKDFPMYCEFCGYNIDNVQQWSCYVPKCSMYVPNVATGLDTFDSYEEALSAGIDKAIEIINKPL